MLKSSTLALLNRLSTLVFETDNNELQGEFEKFDEKVRELLKDVGPSIHVEQHIEKLEENANAFGVYIEKVDVGPRTDARLRDILDELIALHKKQLVHKVFISSTWQGMNDFRQALSNRLSQWSHFELITPEKLVPSAEYPIKQYQNEITQCDIFIGIYGERYGPTFSESPRLELKAEESMTELELQVARKNLRRCFCFLSDATVAQPSRLEVPEFSRFYKPPILPVLIWRALKSWWRGEPNPDRQEKDRERYRHELTRRYVDSYNERMTVAYHALLKLHEVVQETHNVHRFRSSSDVVSEVESLLDAYLNWEATGLIPPDLRSRWNQWARETETNIESRMPFLGSHLPSSLEDEITITPNDKLPLEQSELPQEEGPRTQSKAGLWLSFITNVWHDEIKELHREANRLTVKLIDEYFLSDIIQEPDHLPSKLFEENYEIIALELKKRLLCQTKPEDAKGQLETKLDRVWELCDRWRDANNQLIDMIKGLGFDNEDKWHQDVRGLAEEVNQSADDFLSSPYLTEVIRLPEALPNHLFDQDREDIEFHVTRWCRSHKYAHQTARKQFLKVYSDLRNVFDQWYEASSTLRGSIEMPQFGRCLCIIGREGAGKSHFVTRLLRRENQVDICPLYLSEPKLVGNWETFLCEAAQLKLEWTGGSPKPPNGPEWRGLKELDLYLSGQTGEEFQSTPLVVVIDGLEDWIHLDSRFVEKLGTFIEENTQLHTLYWVLTLSESEHYLVDSYESLWTRYGFGVEGSSAGVTDLPGWLSLDDLNEEANIWEQIIEPERISEEMFDPASRRLLSTPFIAWIVAELELLPELPNLNFIDFVQKLWDHRLEELTRMISEQGQDVWLKPVCIRAIKLIATRFAISGEVEFPGEDLPKYLAEWDVALLGSAPTRLSDPAIAKAIVRALKKRYFIVPKSRDPERFAEEGDILQLDILPFWQYQGGLQISKYISQREYDLDVAKQIVKHRLSSESDEVSRAGGLLEFTILCLDQMAVGKQSEGPNEAARNCVQNLTEFVVREVEDIRSNIWLAAAKASPTYQRTLGQWLDGEANFTFEERRELHCFMYFLKNARLRVSEDDLPPHLRLKLLQPYYMNIGELGLEGYFGKLVNHILVDWVGVKEIARAIAYLYGVESFWGEAKDLGDEDEPGDRPFQKLYWLAGRDKSVDGQTLCRWIEIMQAEKELGSREFGRLCSQIQHRGDVNWDILVKRVLIMLIEMSQSRYERGDLLKKLREAERRRIDERKRIWSCVVGRFCTALVVDKQVPSVEWLAERGWFKWSDQLTKMHWVVWWIMEEQLTTALGRWYRRCEDQQGKVDFIECVEALVGSGVSDKKVTAAYLIYHTVPNTKPIRKLDHDRLWELLDTLYSDNDPKIRRVFEREALRFFYDEQRSKFRPNDKNAKQAR